MKQWQIATLVLVMMAAPLAAWAAVPVSSPPLPGKAAAPTPSAAALAPAAVEKGRAPDPAPAPAAKAPMSVLEEMRAAFKDAPMVVAFEVEAVDGKEDISTQVPWQLTCNLVEPIKGKLPPGQFFIHVTSVAKTFDQTRLDVIHKDFVAMLRPLSANADRRFVLVGPRAYAADSVEAQQLRLLTQIDGGEGTGGSGLKLDVATLARNYPVAGPKIVEVRLTNNGADTASYLQSPLCEKDGKLYVTGQGMIRVRDIQGRPVPDRGNVVQGQMPPPPPSPAIILANAAWPVNLDLSKYFDLPEGRYTLAMAVATPDGRSKVSSALLSLQVGGTPPPEPVPARVPPVSVPVATATAIDMSLPEVVPLKRATGPTIPDPSKYAPGKTYKGLAGLLRPAKARFALGEPVDVEFRLINDGPITIVADSRLERTLTLSVATVGESPEPLRVHLIIPWPADTAAMPEERAYLREGAFWGRIIKLNSLWGKDQEEMRKPTAEEITNGKSLPYERFGEFQFGFPKPGIYTVTAKYSVAKSAISDVPPGAEQHKEWWTGDIQTNTITIQILEPGER